VTFVEDPSWPRNVDVNVSIVNHDFKEYEYGGKFKPSGKQSK
jgi:hypothetical protein